MFVDSGDCTAQDISGVSDIPEVERAAVGPVLASEYLYYDCVHCFLFFLSFLIGTFRNRHLGIFCCRAVAIVMFWVVLIRSCVVT